MIYTTDLLAKQKAGYSKIDSGVFLIISVLLTVYLIIRAILVPMAHDEIATFYYFVQSGKVSPFLSNIDTNNHFLNSALTWVFYHLFGPAPLSLRLSNLIFVPVFFYFVFKITQHLTSRILRYVFFLSLAFTLHFIEFLALSRGYGMSMAMLLGSIYFLLETLNRQKIRNLVCSLGFIFAACTANLALINTYSLILLFIGIKFLFDNVYSLKTKLTVFLSAGILPFSLVVVQIFYIRSHAGLIAGSPENFWATTIITLFSFLFEIPSLVAGIVAAVFFAFIGISGFAVVYKLKKFAFMLQSKSAFLLYLFSGSIVSILLLRLLLGVNYPDDRIGTYLYPLALCSLIFFIDELYGNSKWTYLFALPFIIIPLHFMAYLNTTYSIWYKYDVIPRRFYEKVMQNHIPGSIPPTIAGHGMRIFCWSYLDYLKGGVASQFYFTHFPDYNADFQIVNLKMIPGWQQYYDTIDFDAVSERHLLKLRKAYESHVLKSLKIGNIERNSNEFVPIADGSADTLRNKNLRVELNLTVLAAKVPFNARIVFDIWDSQNKSLRYEYIQFNWLRNVWDAKNGKFNNCMLVYNIPPESALYKIYIWNIDKTEVEIRGGSVRLVELLKKTDSEIPE